MAIRLLDSDTIGKIAAGEVVERPLSVVKELLENALDAGATHIAVSISGGGIEQIEIADDGCGMAPEELPVALQRHATSKLRTFDDLDMLSTLGFRGEALPSIAAISRMSIRTRIGGAAAGAQLDIEYGEVSVPRVVACAAGTTVSVRNLFSNVPARRKFLRQPSTEAGTITRLVAAYAVAYPAVRLSLTVDGRRVFLTDGSGDPIAAATGVFGVEVGGAAIQLEPLDEAAAVPGVRVKGWVCEPGVNRSNRQQILLFVNGRSIQNRQLMFAVEEAYHSLLMIGRHPVAYVDIRVDPAAVDVNVHPTKAEIRFADERAVFRAVQRSVHAALAKAPADQPPRIVFQPPSRSPGERQAVLQQFQASPGVAPNGDGSASDVDPVRPGRSLPMLRVLGQVGGTYIIAEGPEGLYLIDQHAAHERVMYERILGQIESAELTKQPLLDPMVVELTPEEMAVYERSREELERIGFEIVSFGAETVAIRGVPAMVTGVDVRERFRLILDELAAGGAGTSWLDSVAISTACHTSIRAGQQLTLQEMRELVAQLERTRHPRACGHGRPTMLLMSQNDLAKQFARR